MRITKDDARLLHSAIYDAKYDLVKNLTKEKALTVITELQCLENELRKNMIDRRRKGRKSADTFNDLLNKITDLNESSFTNIALMAHSHPNQISYKMLNKQQTESILYNVQNLDPSLDSWNEIIQFWNTLVNSFSVQFIDYLGCAILNDSNWNYVIFDQLDGLDIHSTARFRASNNNTGNLLDALS